MMRRGALEIDGHEVEWYDTTGLMKMIVVLHGFDLDWIALGTN